MGQSRTGVWSVMGLDGSSPILHSIVIPGPLPRPPNYERIGSMTPQIFGGTDLGLKKNISRPLFLKNSHQNSKNYKRHERGQKLVYLAIISEIILNLSYPGTLRPEKNAAKLESYFLTSIYNEEQ